MSQLVTVQTDVSQPGAGHQRPPPHGIGGDRTNALRTAPALTAWPSDSSSHGETLPDVAVYRSLYRAVRRFTRVWAPTLIR